MKSRESDNHELFPEITDDTVKSDGEAKDSPGLTIQASITIQGLVSADKDLLQV